jgi:hypothetical protein
MDTFFFDHLLGGGYGLTPGLSINMPRARHIK